LRRRFEVVGELFVFLLLVLLFSPTVVSSMPPHPKLLDKIAKGVLQVPQHAFSAGETKDLKIVFDTVLKRDVLRVQEKGLTGTIRAVMLLVDFSDNPHQVEKSFFEDLANSIGLNWTAKYSGSTNRGSIKEYYSWISRGKINLVMDIYGWFRAPNDYSYYVNDNYGLGNYPENAQKLVEDAIEVADPYVDFSKYDNDKDGYIDMLLVVHAGPGAEFTGRMTDIWSHEWSIFPKSVDGVYAKSYAMEPELWKEPNDMTIGVYCHEMGHVLGLPDLYDKDKSSYGLGKWSLMAYGAWNGENQMGGSPAGFDAWCKLQTGWYNAEILNEGQINELLPPVMKEGNLIAIYKDDFGNSKEYFLMENRQLEGFDSYLPESGLLIYHIDENKYDNTEEWYPGLDPSGHYMVALEQSDGNFDLEKKNNLGDSYDPFPGVENKTAFTPLTSPSSNYYQDYSGILVRNIEEIGDDINIDLSFNDKPIEPFSPSPSDLENDVPTSVTLSWKCDDPDGDILKYDIYFGVDSENLPLIESNYASSSYHIDDLNYDTQYYWKIIANDGKGGISSSPIWSFTTISSPQSISMKEVKVPNHLIYGNSNLLKFQIFSDQLPVNIDVNCDSTVTHAFDEEHGILSVYVEPLKGPTTLNITVQDSIGHKKCYSKTFEVFSLISQKSLVSSKVLITVVEYGFDEKPNSQIKKQREGVYYMFAQDDVILFDEYLFNPSDETIEPLSSRGGGN